LPSALNNQSAVDQKLSKELAAGRLAGPFIAAPLHPFRVSPLGLVPKVSWRVSSDSPFIFSSRIVSQ
jgi:hypothetical protein